MCKPEISAEQHKLAELIEEHQRQARQNAHQQYEHHVFTLLMPLIGLVIQATRMPSELVAFMTNTK